MRAQMPILAHAKSQLLIKIREKNRKNEKEQNENNKKQ